MSGKDAWSESDPKEEQDIVAPLETDARGELIVPEEYRRDWDSYTSLNEEEETE